MSTTVLKCNEIAIKLFNEHQNPGDDSRRMAVVHIAIHNALNYIRNDYETYYVEPKYDSSGIKQELNNLTGQFDINATIIEAANKALEWAIEDRYPQDKIEIGPPDLVANRKADKNKRLSDLSQWYLSSIGSISETEAKTNGRKLGELASLEITNRANVDGRAYVNELSTWSNSVGPYLFRPDYYQKINGKDKFIENWGKEVIPFCTRSNDQFQQAGPRRFRMDKYEQEIYPDDLRDIKEVKKYGVKYDEQSDKVKNELKAIINKTIYWSDVKSHVIWNDFTRRIISYRNSFGFPLGEWEIARILALVHTTMADSASAVLNDIYKFNHWRPVTAIRYLWQEDYGSKTLAWTPFIYPLPRVPEYPSGFSVIGSAVGEILIGIFGNDTDVLLPSRSLSRGGRPIKYRKISDAVKDNAITKIYCGWNFRKSATDGIIQGKKIGRYILDNHFRKLGEIPAESVSKEIKLPLSRKYRS